jgi:hypothetical protein
MLFLEFNSKLLVDIFIIMNTNIINLIFNNIVLMLINTCDLTQIYMRFFLSILFI